MFRSSPSLQGFQIPGLDRRLIINLFADDTVLYLSATDHYATVEDILMRWCASSGAKFNIEKTEIIPIGSLAHRQGVCASRRLSPQDPSRVPQNVRIAADGHAVRSLGAWIGNKVAPATPWEPILDKIHTALAQWELGHPSLFGKRLIIQMVVGGMTQYLTKVQGMPRHIESAITKMIRSFIWTASTGQPPLALHQLFRDPRHGGLGVLDVAARNEAIELT
ncbi:hypothetical protein FA95DRAFT_1479721, partial [Auriscalpium vulgare]